MMSRWLSIVLVAFGCSGSQPGEPAAPASRSKKAAAAGADARPSSAAGALIDPDALPAGAVRRFGSLRFRASGPVAVLSNGWLVGDWLGDVRLYRPSGRYSSVADHMAVVALDDDRLVAVGRERIELLDLDGRTQRSFEAPECRLLARFSDDGRLVACSNLGKTAIYDTRAGKKLLAVRVGHVPGLDTIALRANTAAFRTPTSLDIFAVPSGKRIRRVEYPSARSIALSRDGKVLYSTEPKGVIRAQNAATGKERWRFEARGDRVFTTLRVSPDGKFLATHVFDAEPAPRGTTSVALLDIARLRLRVLGPVSSNTGEYLDFSPDGRRLAAAPGGGYEIVLFDTATGERLRGPDEPEMLLMQAAVTQARVAAVALTGQLRIWSRKTGARLVDVALRPKSEYRQDYNFSHLQFVGKKSLFVLDSSGEIQKLDARTGTVKCRGNVPAALQQKLIPVAATGQLAIVLHRPGQPSEIALVGKDCKVAQTIPIPDAGGVFVQRDGTLRLVAGNEKYAWYEEIRPKRAKRGKPTPVPSSKQPIDSFLAAEFGLSRKNRQIVFTAASGEAFPLAGPGLIDSAFGNVAVIVGRDMAGRDGDRVSGTVVRLPSRKILGEIALPHPRGGTRFDKVQFDPRGRFMVVEDGQSVLLYDFKKLR